MDETPDDKQARCNLCGSIVDIKADLYGDCITIHEWSLTGEDLGRAFDMQKQQYNETLDELAKSGIKLKDPWWEVIPVMDHECMGLREWIVRWRAKKVVKDE